MNGIFLLRKKQTLKQCIGQICANVFFNCWWLSKKIHSNLSSASAPHLNIHLDENKTEHDKTKQTNNKKLKKLL